MTMCSHCQDYIPRFDDDDTCRNVDCPHRPPPPEYYDEGHAPRDPGQSGPCPGHEWAYSGTAYGGDDDSYHGEGRAYCIHCGADGDA